MFRAKKRILLSNSQLAIETADVKGMPLIEATLDWHYKSLAKLSENPFLLSHRLALLRQVEVTRLMFLPLQEPNKRF